MDYTPTNIFSNTSFDILQMDIPEDPLTDIHKLAVTDLEESYLLNSIRFINSLTTEFTNSKSKLYRSINEANGNSILLAESFSDFYTSAKAIIDKFIKFIKEITDKYIYNQKTRINYTNLKDIPKVSGENGFNIDGFNYTFNPDIPSSKLISSLGYSLFNDYINDNTLSTDINNTNKFDEFRALILKLTEDTCSEFDFCNACYRAYRSNQIESQDIYITYKEAKDALDRYNSFNKVESCLKDQIKETEKAYNILIDQLKNISKTNGGLNPATVIDQFTDTNIKYINDVDINGANNAADIMNIVDVFIKQRIEDLIEYTNIHTIAFSAKLDALRDSFMQDENIINTANRIWTEEEK